MQKHIIRLFIILLGLTGVAAGRRQTQKSIVDVNVEITIHSDGSGSQKVTALFPSYLIVDPDAMKKQISQEVDSKFSVRLKGNVQEMVIFFNFRDIPTLNRSFAPITGGTSASVKLLDGNRFVISSTYGPSNIPDLEQRLTFNVILPQIESYTGKEIVSVTVLGKGRENIRWTFPIGSRSAVEVIGKLRDIPDEIPPIPPGESLEANVNKTHCVSNYFANNSIFPELEQYGWFALMVTDKEGWDYKRRGYEDFGNFNYGATGAALGIPENVLLRAAGWYQIHKGTSRPEFGTPGAADFIPFILMDIGKGTRCNGDDCNDQRWIKKGIDWYKAHYKERKCQ